MDDLDSNTESGLVARDVVGDNAPPLTITEISSQLKRSVEERFGYVRLRGELSGVKRAASGHFYCALKDDNAVIDGVMWKGNAARLAFKAEDGIEVIATGKLTTYPGRSKYQIVIDTMEIAGEGALLALLEKTRARLAAEGLFDAARKKPLPFLPRVIGVVTSPTGSVIRDILHRLADRFPSHVLVWPVLVQGQGSAAQVARAIQGFAEMETGGKIPRPDLVIVARGGGSIEDLWGFNEEVVVRAIAECPIPIISAVGHETDTTLADFAADMRAPTPTAAAEMAVPVRAELGAMLDEYALRQKRAIARPIALGRERLEVRARRLPSAQTLFQGQAQSLDGAAERLKRALRDRLSHGAARLSSLRLHPTLLTRNWREKAKSFGGTRFSAKLITGRAENEAARFSALSRLHQSLNPKAPLQRGFVLAKDESGALIRSAAAAKKLSRFTVEFADGEVAASPDGALASPSPSKPKARRTAPSSAPLQDDLFT